MMEMDFFIEESEGSMRIASLAKRRRHLPICFNYCTERKTLLSLLSLWINNFTSKPANVII